MIQSNNVDQLQIRKAKGLEIAKTGKISLQGNKWRVPSQSINKYYDVTLRLDKSECNCPDYEERQLKCKHIFAVETTVSQSLSQDGRVTVTETKRITYSQNWSAYNASQLNEQELFMKLLGELCKEIEGQPYTFGRPKIPLGDMIFGSALKVYSTFSLRRFMCDMRVAKERGHITTVSSYSTVSNYMKKEELISILHKLIALSAQPLKEVEANFAIDSSGFRTTKFNEYMKHRYNMTKEHDWIKLHICCGTKTNIITAVEVDMGGDSPQFIPLTQKTVENGFTIKEMSADKAYSSMNNYNAIQEIGGQAYIPFKKNATGRANGSSGHSRGRLWRKMFNYFQLNQEDFLMHYHQRSNVESTFSMMKAKFTDLVRSKDKIAQVNEVLLKVLCHNIVVLIQEIHELGIEPNFLGV